MGETTDQIETRIEDKRGALRSNLEELEDKVKSVTDWRHRFRNNPGLMLGLALGGGILLARMIGRPRARTEGRMISSSVVAGRSTRRSDGRKTQMLHIWEDIQGALIGAVTSKITNTLAEVVPGFRSHFGTRRESTGVHGNASVSGNGVQGEGDYEAARRYRTGVGNFVRSANIERAAREAAPQSEDEARELTQAEEKGRNRGKPS